MDLDDFRSILREYGVDVWTMIEAGISVASADFGRDLKERRDGIVERLYSMSVLRCPNCVAGGVARQSGEGALDEEKRMRSEKETGVGNVRAAASLTDGEEDLDPVEECRDSIDREKNSILAIKEQLEDLSQPEDFVVELLQSLADMDITFKALKETDIGRHVNALRKHSSSEVRRLVKQLVRKWKELVDEWVKSDETAAPAFNEGDSPPQLAGKSNSSGNRVSPKAPDFGYSPNCQNGSSGSDKYIPQEIETKGKGIPRREPKQNLSNPPASAATSKKEYKDSLVDPERLASARKRLHENYQEAQNAKKQRTIQVMDIHELPKPKNAFFARNKGGFQAKHY